LKVLLLTILKLAESEHASFGQNSPVLANFFISLSCSSLPPVYFISTPKGETIIDENRLQ
jgi:hypothetical protein